MIHKGFSGAATRCGVIHRGDGPTSGGCQATPLWITLCSFIIQGGDFFAEGAEDKASRLIPPRLGAFSESLPIPADASGAYRPDPQATTRPAPGRPFMKGYLCHFS